MAVLDPAFEGAVLDCVECPADDHGCCVRSCFRRLHYNQVERGGEGNELHDKHEPCANGNSKFHLDLDWHLTTVTSGCTVDGSLIDTK